VNDRRFWKAKTSRIYINILFFPNSSTLGRIVAKLGQNWKKVHGLTESQKLYNCPRRNENQFWELKCDGLKKNTKKLKKVSREKVIMVIRMLWVYYTDKTIQFNVSATINSVCQWFSAAARYVYFSHSLSDMLQYVFFLCLPSMRIPRSALSDRCMLSVRQKSLLVSYEKKKSFLVFQSVVHLDSENGVILLKCFYWKVGVGNRADIYFLRSYLTFKDVRT